jgi:DNA-binding transcriptional LysR family regulator
LDAAEQAVSNLQSKPQGKIKLTAPVTYGEQQLLPLVNDFMVRYSDIEVTAFLSNQKMDLIDGGYDLAIRIGKLSDSTMMAKNSAIVRISSVPRQLILRDTVHRTL